METRLLLTSIVVIFFTGPSAAKDLLRVCYYSNWSQYRNSVGKFFPENIDPHLCTHLVYSFAKLGTNYELATYEWNDDVLYGRFNGLKTQNDELKTLIAVGGWNEGSEKFTALVSDPALRANFVSTSVTFVQKWGFDGLDLDWEYPAARGGSPSDKANFAKLLQELRAAFDAESPKLLLTAAVPAGKPYIDGGYDVPELNKNLDYIFLMAYDLHGAWEDETGFNAPLYQRTGETDEQQRLNVAWASNYWASEGISKDKLIIGLATYGRSFTLTDTTDYFPGASARGAGPQGPQTASAGFLAYYEICNKLDQGTRYWDAEQKVPYLVVGSEWIGYDDIQSITEKVNWIVDGGFGGAMVWNIDLDDFNQNCAKSSRPYPLMNAMKDILEGNDPPQTTEAPGTTDAPETTDVPDPTEAPDTTDAPDTTEDPAETTTDASTDNPTDSPTTDSTTQHTGFCSSKADGFYADPYDCQMFYHCEQKCTYHKSCPKDLRWNNELKYCDMENNVNCVELTTTEGPKQTTAPENTESFCEDKQDGLYQDTNNCSMYFHCATGNTFHKPCPGDLQWNQNKKVCDFASNVNCGTTDPPSTKETSTAAPITSPNTSPITTSITSPKTTDEPSDFSCEGKINGIYKNYDDCGSYFICWEGVATPVQCTDGQLFDAHGIRCKPSAEVDCSLEQDIDFCIGRYGLSPYPADCQKYYNCANGLSYIMTCPDPQVFNAVNGYCDWDYNVNCSDRQIN